MAIIGATAGFALLGGGVVTPVGGIFVYSGGAPYAISSIRTAPVTLVDETRADSRVPATQ